MPPPTWLARLGVRTAAMGTVLCLGIDPDVAALPAGLPSGLAGVERFAAMCIDAAGPHAAAVKVNLAFFEAWGSPGVAALERVRARIPADLPFIADAKRGDIGSTSARIAEAVFDRLDAHAVTANPYLGADALAPLLERADRHVFLLCRTSNPGAGELQDLVVREDPMLGAPAETFALRVARRAASWARHPGTVGLVVGATAPEEIARIRAVAPTLPFLVPGVGTQGGDAERALMDGPASAGPAAALAGGGLLVNVSRGIAGAALGAADPAAAIAAAAERWAAILRVLR
ncbi:MAG: orotidine-5'-phosphate decarboxylase [Chloroflexota bacterium]